MPVAAVGETVAVNVMSVPTVVDVLDAFRVIVDDVVPEELPELPQPVPNSTAKASAPKSIARKTKQFFNMEFLLNGVTCRSLRR